MSMINYFFSTWRFLPVSLVHFLGNMFREWHFLYQGRKLVIVGLVIKHISKLKNQSTKRPTIVSHHNWRTELLFYWGVMLLLPWKLTWMGQTRSDYPSLASLGSTKLPYHYQLKFFEENSVDSAGYLRTKSFPASEFLKI
jgi:hypothetical protein